MNSIMQKHIFFIVGEKCSNLLNEFFAKKTIPHNINTSPTTYNSAIIEGNVTIPSAHSDGIWKILKSLKLNIPL